MRQDPTSWLILSLPQDERKVTMHMSEVGYSWGEKIFQQYNSQLKLIDVRWVTHKDRAPPYKSRSPGPLGALLGHGTDGVEVTVECLLSCARRMSSCRGGDYVREVTCQPVRDMRRLSTVICFEKLLRWTVSSLSERVLTQTKIIQYNILHT
jgi:hypothetical protein